MFIYMLAQQNKLTFGHLHLCMVSVNVCLYVQGLSVSLQGADLIEILTSGTCSKTTDITSLCATASHWVQITPEGC